MGKRTAASVSRSTKAGLQFPVSRIARYLKAGRYAERVGSGAPVYLAAVLEYLAAEVNHKHRSIYPWIFLSPFLSSFLIVLPLSCFIMFIIIIIIDVVVSFFCHNLTSLLSPYSSSIFLHHHLTSLLSPSSSSIFLHHHYICLISSDASSMVFVL